MILYFSATGNSLAVARQLAERLNEQIIRELEEESHVLHYSWFGLLSWLLGRPVVERGMIHCLGPKVIADKCTGCGTCVRVCPMENIRMADNKAHTGDHCTVCLACVK